MPRQLQKGKSDLSRLRRFAQNHLGVIMTDEMDSARVVRSQALEELDSYYESTQYDELQEWDQAVESENYVQIRKRKPRIIYNVSRMVCDKVAAKLIGESTFPQFIIEEEDDDTAFLKTVAKACKFRTNLIAPIKRLLNAGSVFVRYQYVDGIPVIEYALSKYCYPVFDKIGELDSIEIKYVYSDLSDRDKNGNPKNKWYRMELTKTSDTLFDNPEYKPGVAPTFVQVEVATHNLGWVQGEWFVTHKDKHDYDGYGLCSEILGFIDALNYSLSQSDQASAYSQEPQMGINGVDEDELETLIRSSQKAWNLGKEGKAEYIESDMKGIEGASELRNKMKVDMFEVVRCIFHDPEKVSGQAQSGEALKQMNMPLVELVDELRAVIQGSLTNLLIKIAMTALFLNTQGEDATIIQTPPGYQPTSLDITVQWPPIFPATLDDIVKMAQAATALSQGQIISRETLTRWVAQVIPSVDNVEEELKKIESQEPLPSPFGTFDQGGQ